MQVLEALKQAIRICANVVRMGAGIQAPERKGLAADLQAICSACEDAYATVLARLVPIKNAFGDPALLASELRAFAADVATRDKFKPEHLCHQVDHLLVRLRSNLDPLKYSIDCREIKEIRAYLQKFGDFDGAIFQSYDDLVAQLDEIATQIQLSAADQQERSDYARHIIQRFEKDLRETQKAVREAKNEVIGLI